MHLIRRESGRSWPVETTHTRPRPTPPPAATRFRQVLDDAASGVLSHVEAASAALPGGPVVSASVRSAGGAPVTRAGSGLSVAGASEAPEGPGAAPAAGDPGTWMAGFADDSLRLIALQQEIQAENRQYTALSNVLKTRHETAKNAIGNLR